MPMDVVKRIVGESVNQVQSNLKTCMTTCQETFNVAGKESDVFEKELHECKITCLEQNKDIMKGLEKELGEQLPLYKKELYNTFSD